VQGWDARLRRAHNVDDLEARFDGEKELRAALKVTVKDRKAIGDRIALSRRSLEDAGKKRR
jgi:hypothetical protein